MNLLILDSGHAKSTAGKVAPDKSLYEWKFNDDMQYKLKKRAEEHNIEVYLTNPYPATTKDIALSTRAKYASDYYKSKGKPRTMMISLHANAYGEWTSARGVEVFHADNASKLSKDFALDLTNQIYSDMKKVDSGFLNRGRKCSNYTVIQKTVSPCVLVEYAFYTNRQDLALLKNNKDDFVEATMKSLCKYYGIAYVPPKSSTSSSNTNTSAGTKYHRVIAGSFQDKSNANKLVAELKSKGYKSVDIYSTTVDSKLYYRVSIGSFTNKSNADNEVAKLKALGYSAFIDIVYK